MSAATATGQDQNVIFFQGKVLDSKTLVPLPGSQITVNRRFNTFADDKGEFALFINSKDTLRFSRVGYKPVIFIRGDSLSVKQYVGGIFMNSDTVDIGEVIIMPRLENLKSEIINSPYTRSQEMENARYNVAISGYQGRTTTGNLGNPDANYDVIRQRTKINDFEKGGIPSDQIAAISPFMLIPAAYLLMHGLPEKPAQYKPTLTDSELDQIIKNYLKKQRK